MLDFTSQAKFQVGWRNKTNHTHRTRCIGHMPAKGLVVFSWKNGKLEGQWRNAPHMSESYRPSRSCGCRAHPAAAVHRGSQHDTGNPRGVWGGGGSISAIFLQMHHPQKTSNSPHLDAARGAVVASVCRNQRLRHGLGLQKRGRGRRMLSLAGGLGRAAHVAAAHAPGPHGWPCYSERRPSPWWPQTFHRGSGRRSHPAATLACSRIQWTRRPGVHSEGSGMQSESRLAAAHLWAAMHKVGGAVDRVNHPGWRVCQRIASTVGEGGEGREEGGVGVVRGGGLME